MRDECLDGLLALAEPQGQLTRLPQIIQSRPAVAVGCLVLLIPLAVCPVCGREQPNAGTARRSEMGQLADSCSAEGSLFNHLVGAAEQRRRDIDAERLDLREHRNATGLQPEGLQWVVICGHRRALSECPL